MFDRCCYIYSSAAPAFCLELPSDAGSLVSAPILSSLQERVHPQFEHVVWTREMKRMAVLVGRAVRFKEPVLLIGETGYARGAASVGVASVEP